MIREDNKESFVTIISSPFPLINAVLNKSQGGKIFSGLNSYFVLHKSGFSYLKTSTNTNYSGIFDFFLYSGELPQYFHIYDAPTMLITICNENLQSIGLKIRKRIQLKYSNAQLAASSVGQIDYTVSRIDKNNFDKLSVFHLFLESRFWRSKEDFLTNGFGFAVMNMENLPVSICYTSCLADGIAEIDIATLSEYQNRGLAKLAVTYFLRYCLENGVIANWDCFEDNYGSLKTAESVGFKPAFEYNFVSIFNKMLNHE